MKQVAHLMRKLLPPTASFIYNQINCYHTWIPHALYCESVGSGFAERLQTKYPIYCPLTSSVDQQWYRYMRRLTPRAQRRLIRYLQATNIDLLHVHYGVDALVYSQLFAEIQRPVLVSFYGYDCTSFPNRFWKLGKKWLQHSLFNNSGVSAYTAMSPDMKEDLMRLGCPEEKIIVHYHGSDTQPFYYRRAYTDKSDVHLLIISSLTAKKGHHFLLEAFQKAQARSVKELTLHIVGDGELEHSLKAFIQERGMKRVYLHGAVPYGSEEHRQFLRQADIFVHPSVTTPRGEKEGIPGALMEARASGLPIIATNHAGIPYVVQSGETGWLVPEYDVSLLSEAIVRLTESTELRAKLGAAGQSYTIQQLDVNERQKELEQIYQVLKSKSE